MAALMGERERFLLGITGIPGSGKSTFAEKLVEAIDARTGPDRAVAIPMDGFHYPNAVLRARGLRAVKGSQATFNVPAFVRLLHQLRQTPPQTVLAPAYDRKRHEPLANAVTITPTMKLIVVEGNYLLLNEPPWFSVRTLLDQVWFIDVPIDLAMTRVRARHIAGGCDEKTADKKIATNDLPNAEQIVRTRIRADRIVTLFQRPKQRN